MKNRYFLLILTVLVAFAATGCYVYPAGYHVSAGYSSGYGYYQPAPYAPVYYSPQMYAPPFYPGYPFASWYYQPGFVWFIGIDGRHHRHRFNGPVVVTRTRQNFQANTAINPATRRVPLPSRTIQSNPNVTTRQQPMRRTFQDPTMRR